MDTAVTTVYSVLAALGGIVIGLSVATARDRYEAARRKVRGSRAA